MTAGPQRRALRAERQVASASAVSVTAAGPVEQVVRGVGERHHAVSSRRTGPKRLSRRATSMRRTVS
jgi:hypothetical protein